MVVTSTEEKNPAQTSTPRWRRGVGISLIVLGAILAPVALVSNWAVTELTDTDAFVATFAPLAQDPEVQKLVADTVTEAIDERVDLPAITGPVFDGLGEDLGPLASTGLSALEGVVNGAIRQLVASTIDRFVSSDAFANVWESALRVTHTQVINALESDGSGAITVDGGTIGIQIGPIVEAAKTALVEQGLTFAANLPEVDRTIVVAKSEGLGQLQVAYAWAVAVASWLPWIALLLLVAGGLVAGAGLFSVVFSAAGVAATMALLLIGLAIGRAVVIAELVAAEIPPAVAALVFEQVLGRVYATAIGILVIAGIVAVTAWLFKRFDVVNRLREWRASVYEARDHGPTA